MCSSMCREFGLAGDWRSQASQVVLPLSRRFSRSSRRCRCVRQRLGQGFVDAPVGAGDGLGAGALDGVERGQDDRLPPQMLNQGAGQHDAFVGLHGQLGQRMHGLPVVAHGERLEAEHRLQLDQVLAPGLLPLPVIVPAFDRHLELAATMRSKGGNGGSSTPRMMPGSAGSKAARRSPAGSQRRAAAG
jgi:hypothetical protein